MALKFAGQQVAIITDDIRKQLLQTVFDESGDSDVANNYYVGYAKSTEWDATDLAPTPENTNREEKQFRYNLQSVKAIEGRSFVVPRFNWTSGRIYSAYDDNTDGHPVQSFYVLTEDNNVYLCVRQGKTTTGAPKASSNKPDHTNVTYPVENDGYVWKYLYTLTTNDQNRFTTANYIPVSLVDSAESTDPTFAQFTVQQAAISGQITGFRIVNNGTGFDNEGTLSITVEGDGGGCHARGIIDTVTETLIDVQIADSAGGYPFGRGYNKAIVTVTGGGDNATGASVVPIFAPKNGLGADPRDDLKSTALMMNIKPIGGVEVDGVNKFVINNDFRQVGLLRNPADSSGLVNITTSASTALSKFDMTSKSVIDFSTDEIVTGDNSGAKAYIDFYSDSSPGQIWWHQDETTGFKEFDIAGNENITTPSGAQAQIASKTNSEVDIFSGDLLYIDNRPIAISRSEDQTEDVKVVIQL